LKNNIAVIIVTFNGEKWIQKCLNSILNADSKLQIFVVDNASNDGTIKLLEDFTTIQVIESKINLGFGKANNLAVKKAMEAGFDTFFLLNQDTWIFEHTVSNLVQKINENPNYGILSPLHYGANGIDLDSNFENYYNKQGKITSNSNIKNTDFVNAAAWLVSKKCFEKVGLFDPIFSHYGEDRNFCNRVLYHNFEIGIIDNAKICHDRIIKRSFGKDILQSKYLILNNLININNPLLSSILKSFKQVFGLPKFFFKEYKFKKSLLFLHELLIYFFGTLVNLNQIMAIRKTSKRGTNGIE
jgi:GT2 family glycosyltransferase